MPEPSLPCPHSGQRGERGKGREDPVLLAETYHSAIPCLTSGLFPVSGRGGKEKEEKKRKGTLARVRISAACAPGIRPSSPWHRKREERRKKEKQGSPALVSWKEILRPPIISGPSTYPWKEEGKRKGKKEKERKYGPGRQP